MANYQDFLSAKRIVVEPAGMDVPAPALNPVLFDFQRDITLWALRLGRAAVFADCGLGKTLIQLEWARQVGKVLIVAPLSVADQTIEIAKSVLGLEVNLVETAADLASGINITNYEKLHHFSQAPIDGIVLDESSILKSIDGKTRTRLLEEFTYPRFRLCCTATPAPNDIAELANHAEFLGHMRRVEMLAAFFVHDDEGWRLRGHALKPFCRWLASWSVMLKSPADLGYDASGFQLPPLSIEEEIVKTDWRKPGELFAGRLHGIVDRADVRRKTAPERALRAATIAREVEGQVIVWCGQNIEAKALMGHLRDIAVEVEGADPPHVKRDRIERFKRDQVRVLVTKVKIAGFGMNFQNAHTMIFVGLSDSYEQYYQAIRREWRYGQTHPVRAVIVVTDHETEIVRNVRAKELTADSLSREVIAAAREYETANVRGDRTVEKMDRAVYQGQDWKVIQGDCIEAMAEMPESTVDLSVFSPPFSSLYTYSASENDIGNCRDLDEFVEHFDFAVAQLLRVTKPGRLCVMHLAQVATTLVNDGVIGVRDLRGALIGLFARTGWTFHGEITIDKNPQAQAIRTHSKALLFVQLHKDASWLRPALADYVLLFRKPGENAVPIKPDITHDEWIQWARPVWYDIQETDTLNVAEARENDDDRHICPLQLGLIERAIRLWSNPGELVFSPFGGIGSEGYVALQNGRRALLVELKPRYAATAVKNLKRALGAKAQIGLFDGAAAAK